VKRLRAIHPSVDIAVKALTRNRLQTGLTMLGITVGVATVLTMLAVGAGAQRSIEQQVRAAGLNQITVTAGNWKPKVDDTGAAVAHQADAGDTERSPLPRGRVPLPEVADDIALASHPEDNPMEKHDHPLAWQRLGDLEAGLGAAATLTFADAEAIGRLDGVQYVACGVHANARVFQGDKRWFTRMHGTDLQLLDIKRTWTLKYGRFFSDDEQDIGTQHTVYKWVVPWEPETPKE